MAIVLDTGLSFEQGIDMLDTTSLPWLGTLAVVIGGLVRLLKTDTLDLWLEHFSLPPVPKRALPFISIGLGLALGLITGIASGKSFSVALVDVFNGMLAGGGAIVGHQIVIESIRDGKELPLPKIPPSGSVGLILVVVLALQGCAFFTPKNIDFAEEKARDVCIIANASLPDLRILEKCNLALTLLDVVRSLAGAHRAGVQREVDRAKAGVCRESLFTPATYDEFGTVSVSGNGFHPREVWP